MGLKEKRVIKQFQENGFKTFLEQLKGVAGKDIEVNVEWDSIALDGLSHLYEEAWPKVYFMPLLEALKNICVDDMGKEAIAQELEKIVIKNDAGISNPAKWASFGDKTLVLDHKPTTNLGYVADRTKTVQTLLENNL